MAYWFISNSWIISKRSFFIRDLGIKSFAINVEAVWMIGYHKTSLGRNILGITQNVCTYVWWCLIKTLCWWQNGGREDMHRKTANPKVLQKSDSRCETSSSQAENLTLSQTISYKNFPSKIKHYDEKTTEDSNDAQKFYPCVSCVWIMTVTLFLYRVGTCLHISLVQVPLTFVQYVEVIYVNF